MSISVIPSTPPVGAQQSVNMQDFLKILLTQLTYQDPLKPVDNTEFIAQLAQFSSLEQTSEMSDTVTRLLGVQAATQSVGLIGRTVDVANSDGTTQTGQVASINVAGAQPELSINLSSGQSLTNVSLSQIVAVH